MGRALALLALVLALGLAFAGSALADPPTFADDCSTSSDPAVCERLDFIATALNAPLPVEGNVGVHGDGGQSLGVLPDSGSDPWPVSISGDTSVVGSLALSDADHHRLDLMWWGVWALVGLNLVLLIAPRFLRALAPERGLG